MRATSLALIMLCGALLASSLPRHADASDTCRIEDWRWRYESMMNWITVEGVTTCEAGWLTLRAYDENDVFLGADMGGVVMGHTFQSILMDVHRKPSALKIKVSIKQGLF